MVRIGNRETGTRGFGEIAPLPTFGSESLEAAKIVIAQLPSEVSIPDLQSFIGSAPPATAFGLSCAAMTEFENGASEKVHTAALLSLDESTSGQLEHLRNSDYRTFKIKMGRGEKEAEWEYLQKVVSSLVPGERLRLDPNQSWDKSIAGYWIPLLSTIREWIEFIEDPFKESCLPAEELITISKETTLPFALDESLSRNGLEPWINRDWPGHWIIKPSLQGIAGQWLKQLTFAQEKIVVSSVFETGIGLSHLIRLAGTLGQGDHGLGTQAFFNDHLGLASSGGILTELDLKQQESLWNRLPSA